MSSSQVLDRVSQADFIYALAVQVRNGLDRKESLYVTVGVTVNAQLLL